MSVMTRFSKRLLFWMPRVLCLLFAAFVSLFAGDAFSEGLGFWQQLVALAIHLIPTAIVIGVLIVAWRWEAIGGLLLIAAGLGYTASVLAGHHPLSWSAAISGPLFVVGILFLIDWYSQRRRWA